MRVIKWLVAVLVGLNVGIFLYMTFLGPAHDTGGEEGRLPRVAEIELVTRGQGGGASGDAVESSESVAVPVAVEDAVAAADSANSQGAGGSDQPAMVCTVMGWFEDEPAASAAISQLPGELSGRILAKVAIDRPLDDFYWVLIPPLENRASALARSRELSARGIESYAVPSGDYENGISLGLFRSRSSAERILTQRTEQNIEARLVILPRNRISYALVFEGALELIEIPEDALSLGENGQWIRIETGDCESVASARKNP